MNRNVVNSSLWKIVPPPSSAPQCRVEIKECWCFVFSKDILLIFCSGYKISLFQETERLRAAAVRFINSALCKENLSSTGTVGLSEGLEGEIFNQSKKLVSNSYRKLSRKVIFGLQQQERRRALVDGEVSIREFVSDYLWLPWCDICYLCTSVGPSLSRSARPHVTNTAAPITMRVSSPRPPVSGRWKTSWAWLIR